jgi:hypothetical protein
LIKVKAPSTGRFFVGLPGFGKTWHLIQDNKNINPDKEYFNTFIYIGIPFCFSIKPPQK